MAKSSPSVCPFVLIYENISGVLNKRDAEECYMRGRGAGLDFGQSELCCTWNWDVANQLTPWDRAGLEFGQSEPCCTWNWDVANQLTPWDRAP
jgi:hypothetical protein